MADDRAAYRRCRREESGKESTTRNADVSAKDVLCVSVCSWREGKRAPPSPSAREQFRDGTGEAPSLVFLHRVPGASIGSLPGIALLCGCARAARQSKGDRLRPREVGIGVSHVLGFLLALFVGAGTGFSLSFTAARCEITLVKRV